MAVVRAYLRHRLKVRVPRDEDPEVLVDMLLWLESAPDANAAADEEELQRLVHIREQIDVTSLPSDIQVPA